MEIKLVHVTKSFGAKQVIQPTSFVIQSGSLTTLLGPSGCGKTTTLRIIGGFATPDEGKVIFEGKDITNLSPDKRHINTVFQKYSLFSHMSVGENIAFGLKLKKKSKLIYDNLDGEYTARELANKLYKKRFNQNRRKARNSATFN